MNQSKLKFFTNISHELLTPLTIIGCACEELTSNDQRQKHTLSVIKSNVNRLNRLIREILEFRKADKSKLRLQVSFGDLSGLIANICEDNFRLLANKKDIDLTFCSNPVHIKGWFDSDKIDKILYNLLSNAFKYNYSNSFVSVSVREEVDENNNKQAIIEVKDGGIGIAPENISQIFDRFYDGNYRTAKTQGTGIGLSLTKILAELHNGTITVESTLGSGSTFKITFPIDKSCYTNIQVNESDLIEKEQVSKVNMVKQSKSILIVEDNDDLREILVNKLSSYYDMTSATNGEEALQKLTKKDFDMVVSDIMMPVMDGIELCSIIKNNIEYSHIPVILLTAKTTERDMITGYETGADAYILKLFGMDLLLIRISNLFKSRQLLMANSYNSDRAIQLKTITYTSIDEKLLKKAVEIVESNISNENFNFDQFVNEMGVSKSMLYRKIKILTGMATSEFIKDIRLKAACKLLKDSSINISEVAYEVGFNQPKYFTMCFKKKYNMLPSEYQREHS